TTTIPTTDLEFILTSSAAVWGGGLTAQRLINQTTDGTLQILRGHPRLGTCGFTACSAATDSVQGNVHQVITFLHIHQYLAGTAQHTLHRVYVQTLASHLGCLLIESQLRQEARRVTLGSGNHLSLVSRGLLDHTLRLPSSFGQDLVAIGLSRLHHAPLIFLGPLHVVKSRTYRTRWLGFVDVDLANFNTGLILI